MVPDVVRSLPVGQHLLLAQLQSRTAHKLRRHKRQTICAKELGTGQKRGKKLPGVLFCPGRCMSPLTARETEVIHARFAMLGVLGLVLPELVGAPPYTAASLASGRLVPVTIVLVVMFGALEAYRAAFRQQTSDTERRIYPGGKLDPLRLASRSPGTPEDRAAPGLGVWSAWLGGFPGWLSGGWWLERRGKTESEVRRLQTRELEHGRLAMVSVLGIAAASYLTGKGPIELLAQHVRDPLHQTIFQTLQRQ